MTCDAPVKEAGTVYISGLEYRVAEGINMELGDPDTGKSYDVRGAVNPYGATIGLDSDLSTTQRGLTLLHEVIHAVDDVLNVDLSEEQVTALASGLYSVEFKGPRKNDKTRTMRRLFYG